MAACDVQSLLTAGSKFASLNGKHDRQVVKLALMVRRLLVLNPSADVTPASLLNAGKCYACLTPPQRQLIKLQLLCEILNK